MNFWREEFISVNPFSRPGIPLKLVRNIVIHYTANPGATAANHVRYFGETIANQNSNDNQPDTYASAHMFVDATEAVLIIPLGEIAYHASQANPYSIGIEMCIERDGSFHPETVKRTVQIVAELCKQYGLNPLRDVIRHYDVTKKNCPKPYVDDPEAWEAFRQAVNRIMRGEDETNMPMKFEQWQWDMLYEVMGKAYNVDQLDWNWMQKVVDKTLTASELAFLNTVLDGRIDRKIEV